MSILISVPVFNRKKITELSLENLKKYKGDNKLVVYNDHSTDYTTDFLNPLCDEAIKLPKKLGVQHLRWYQFRNFIKPENDEFKFLYLTDNDTLHDPNFIDILMKTYSKYMLPNRMKLPIGMYNTIYHSHIGNKVFENNEVYMRRTMPGVSMFYDKDMVKIIVDTLNKQKVDPDYAFDYRCIEYLNRPVICTKTSYVEHYGQSGLHTPNTGQKSDFDRDRALNPTEYLQSNREAVIDYLMGKNNDKPVV